MAEWLHEDGIGERRAALVEHGRILEMAIETESRAPRAGAVLSARLLAGADAGGRGRVGLDGGGEAMLAPVPADAHEGARLMVEVVREALVEPGGQAKPARVRAVPADRPAAPGPDLAARLAASVWRVRRPRGDGADELEAHGWSEALEEAAGGIVAGPGALLRISLTPAMTLIDVDGAGASAALAAAGATLAGEVIRRFGLAGSIGIDLPTMANRADRLAAAAALDAALPPPFERTAVNGFGFLQIVRRRERASLMEMLAADPVLAAARALLRRAERARGVGALTLIAAPPVTEALDARPGWVAELERRAAAPVRLRVDPALSISAGHAQRDHP